MRIRYIIGGMFVLMGLTSLLGIEVGRFIGPAFLIFLGWMILTGGPKQFEGSFSDSSEDSVNEVVIFSSLRKNVKSPKFRGGKVVSVFSSAEIDLTAAKPSGKIVYLELVSVFAGIRLSVPENWRVTTRETAGIVGGVDNTTRTTKETCELRIKGAAVFGGIEIFNNR